MKNITPLIKLEHVSKYYSNQKIIDNMNITIRTGSIIALLGKNGAGKSTLIKMILGLEKPTAGKITLNGLPSTHPQSRLTVGVVLQDSQFIDELSVRETIQLIRLHYPRSFSLDKIIKDFSLEKFINKRTDTLSQGQKRQLALALAFSGNPKLIFLDEPSVGLDVQSRLSLWHYIKSLKNTDTTIVLTTHHLEEAQFLADRVVILNNGKIIADGDVASILQRKQNTLEDDFIKIIEG
jgi:ABC-2 type transport system ATP-binding protein